MDPPHSDIPPDDATQAELDRVERALRGLGAEPAPADVVSRLDAILDARLPPRPPAWWRRVRLRPVLAIGAPLVALAAAAVVVAPHLGGNGSQGEASSTAAGAAAGAAASSAGAATSALALPQARSAADESAPAATAGAAAPKPRAAPTAGGGTSPRATTPAAPAADVGKRVQQAAEDAYRAAQLAIERSGSPAP